MKLTSKVEKRDNSVVDIIAELSAEDFATYRGQAVQNLGEKVEVKGFRKGNVPEGMLVKQVGEPAVLEEMSQLAISAAYMELIKEHKINALGRPEVSVTKLAPDNPLGFTITTTVMPEIKLPDYKKIAGKVMGAKDDNEVTDKEVDEAIDHLRKMRAGAPSCCTDEKCEDNKCGQEKKEPELPELNDEFVKTMGDFKDVADFKAKLKDNIGQEKQARAAEKKRIDALEQIMDKTKVDVPEVLTSYELDKMMHQMEHDIAMSGMKFDEYLEKIQKTKETLRIDWKETGEKRAKMHMVINAIAEEEKLAPTDEELETETQKLMEQYKDMKDIDEANVRMYVAGILTNQKVFELLEAQK